MVRAQNTRHAFQQTQQGGFAMGKYFIGWLLGVPAIVLVIIYLIAN